MTRLIREATFRVNFLGAGRLQDLAAHKGVSAGEVVECFNPNAAIMKAEGLSRKRGRGGGGAFCRTGTPATGDLVRRT